MTLAMTKLARVAGLSIAIALGTAPAFAQLPPFPLPTARPPAAVPAAPAPSSAAPAVPSQPPAAPSPAQIQASQAEARRLSDGFVAVAERVSPSVVQIDVTAHDDKADILQRFLGHGSKGDDSPVARGMGSGVIFTSDGAILTNNHVVEEALTINVRLRDGRYMPARLIGRDPSTDLAVIKIDAQNLTPAKFGDSDNARVGEWVVAIGSPFGLGYTVTAGVLSAKGRGGLGMNAIEDYLQTDASINPGNSGGPLCNLEGQVLGINTMIVGRGAGIGFAVPASMAQRAASQILKTGHVQRAWLGVGIQDLSPELAAAMKLDPRAGVLVSSVNADGPSYKANLRPGDVIAAVAGKPVHDGHELIRETISHEVGQSVILEITRGGQKYGASVVLAARPEPAVPPAPVQQQQVPHPGMGLSVRDLQPQQAAQMGLAKKPLAIVTQVQPGSAADRAGLRPGDVIIEADGVQEPTSAQLQEQARDGALLLRISRGDTFFYAALKK
jgi:S1-C subfamily serine protease